MNYPVWQLQFLGGGLLIALIAVFHVYISHFAVGGGLFLVLTEIKGRRENNPAILEFTRRHAKFFLLLTMVAGSMTGVGIWFTIALLNPSATSVLIHNFVFGWAIEWVFFLIEIISLFIYAYTFDRLDARTHQLMGWIYFGAAWMSLFIINGIIDCMLTPGQWLESHNFWSGFFNPTYWPSLFFRTFLALMIAGLFGLLTASRIRDQELRPRMVRTCAAYLLIPFALFLASAWWYKASLPTDLRTLIFTQAPELAPYVRGFLLFSPLLVVGGLLMLIRLPSRLATLIAAVLLIIGQLYMGCFEFIREGGRRPYIIRGELYSNSIFKKDLAQVRERGVLASSRWTIHKQVTRDNLMASGQELYGLLCLPCHSIGGPLNDIRPMSKNFTPWGLENFIGAIDRFHPYMPPFPGNRLEAKALATYIASGLNGRYDRTRPVRIETVTADQPADIPANDRYVLLAWSDLGMQAITDAGHRWLILPPGCRINAQLIRRDETPEVITDGVRLDFRLDPAFLPDHPDQAQGRLALDETTFTSEPIPALPYPAADTYMP